MHTDATAKPLPRELAPGVFWLGDCLKYNYQDTVLHAYNSSYLVAGNECSALIEGGHPRDVQLIERQMETLFAAGVPPLRYLFTTHTETPHCAGFGRLLEHFPDTVAVGDVSDLHLVFPNQADRLRPLAPGDELDLGGTEIRIVESVFRDYIYTRWAFDTRRKVLFPGDGMAYTHYHQVGHCGSLAEEAGDLNLPDMTALFAELAFTWTRYVDIEPYIERLEWLIDELDVQIIAPTHGLPIADPKVTMPKVVEGMRLGSAARTIGSIS
jgi:flavorubredoxin